MFKSKPQAQGNEEAGKPGFFSRMMESHREKKLERELAEVERLLGRVRESVPSPAYLRDFDVDFQRLAAYAKSRRDFEGEKEVDERRHQWSKDYEAIHFNFDPAVEKLRKLGEKSEFPQVRDAVAKLFMACPRSDLSLEESNARLYLYNPEYAVDIYAGSDEGMHEFGMKEAARLKEWGIAAALALRDYPSDNPEIEARRKEMLRAELKSATAADYAEAIEVYSMYLPFKESEDRMNDPYYEQQKAIAMSRGDLHGFEMAFAHGMKKENPDVVRLLDAQMRKIKALKEYGPEELRALA